MVQSDVCDRRRCDRDLASVATDHVRLSYHYLNIGDIDGYGSLFGERAVLQYPGAQRLCGRAELERFERQRQRAGRSWHTVFDVVTSGNLVIAIGCLDQSAARPEVEVSVDFIDVFVVSDDGLIAERRTFHFTSAHNDRKRQYIRVSARAMIDEGAHGYVGDAWGGVRGRRFQDPRTD